MADDAVQVKGWPELAAGTEQLATKIGATADHNMAAVAAQVAGQVAAAVPVISGTLAGSAAASPGPPVSVSLGDGVPYAGVVDFGGYRNRPYISGGRYLFPTVQAAEPLVLTAAEQAADTESKGMQWPTPT